MADGRLARNPISIVGAWLTTIAAFAFLTFQAIEWFELVRSPYSGLIGFVALPVLFVLGLLLIPLGMWRESRRRRHGKEPWQWPAIDLGRSRTRQVVMAIGALTIVNLGIVAVAGTGAVTYMESNEFCGQVCHVPMRPEFMAHQVSPHSRVDCVSCHVAPGAAGAVEAKLNGTRQLYLLATGGYSRPIPPPHDRVPRAVETCAGCHTPGLPTRDLTRVIREFASDEGNTETTTILTMNMAAVHWHARPDVAVEYVATDEARETIPYVSVRVGDGPATEFFAEGTTSRPAGTLRRMDCLDCHNRPAHDMSADASQAVDRAIGRGDISRALPFAKREIMAALSETYPDEAAARIEIARRLSQSLGSGAEAAQAIASAQRLYDTNVFPAMKVTWGTYTSQLGHTTMPGCFRCHDDTRKAGDGRLVRQDCELCHKVQ
jgi:cytochrome c553